MASCVVQKDKLVYNLDLKTTLLTGQQLISYGKVKLSKVCVVIFAVEAKELVTMTKI